MTNQTYSYRINTNEVRTIEQLENFLLPIAIEEGIQAVNLLKSELDYVADIIKDSGYNHSVVRYCENKAATLTYCVRYGFKFDYSFDISGFSTDF